MNYVLVIGKKTAVYKRALSKTQDGSTEFNVSGTKEPGMSCSFFFCMDLKLIPIITIVFQ